MMWDYEDGMNGVDHDRCNCTEALPRHRPTCVLNLSTAGLPLTSKPLLSARTPGARGIDGGDISANQWGPGWQRGDREMAERWQRGKEEDHIYASESFRLCPKSTLVRLAMSTTATSTMWQPGQV